MARRQLGKRVDLPAEDFGYQFLVGFGAQTPPCPSASPATQHNCLLIRIDSLTVTVFALFAPGTDSTMALNTAENLLGSHIQQDSIYLPNDFPLPPSHNASLSIAGERGDARKEFRAGCRGGRVVRGFVGGGHLPDEIEIASLNLVGRNVVHIGKWIAEHPENLPRLVVGLR